MTLKKLRNKETIFVICSFAFFIFTMLYRLTYSALWGDEWVEYFYSQSSMLNGDMYNNIISTFQPPLYNFLMYFWLLVRKSVLWFRLFNIILGIISAIFLYKTIRKFYSYVVANISLIALAVCYQWVYCIQECSEYALMVCSIFGAIYFFTLILEEFSKKNFILFLVFCISAIYSQYGAVFVVAPLLMIYFVRVIMQKDKKTIIFMISSYIVCFIAFAIPLYLFFLKIQMNNNEISEHTVSFQISMIKDYFFEFGYIVGYLFNVNKYSVMNIIGPCLGFFFVFTSIYYIIKVKDIRKKMLVLCTLCSYTMHYILVRLQIYAMGQPGNSGGFQCRYSYFYLAIVTIYFVIIFCDFLGDKYLRYLSYLAIAVALVICLSSCIDLKDNWHKNLDDVYADIWLDNEGWNDDTYLLGVAIWGFPHYVSRNEKYIDGRSDRVYIWIDKEALPDRFWLWSSNWSEDEYTDIHDYAIGEGYSVIIYDYTEGIGQLAFFEKQDHSQE